MNKEQCERAAALWKALEKQDAHIAGLKSVESVVEITIKYMPPDDPEPVELRLNVPNDGDPDCVQVRQVLLGIFSAGRDSIIRELRAIGATVSA